MVRVLISGFEPFGGERVNPSWEVASRLAAAEIAGAEISVLRLPVAPGDAFALLVERFTVARPDLVLSLGEGGGRMQVMPERIAINWLDCRDEQGVKHNEPLEPGGPDAYFTTLPGAEMVAAMIAAGVPAALSNSAGTYICNEIAYRTQHWLANNGRPFVAGFVHLPYLPEQVTQKRPTPSMGLQTMLDGVSAALAAAVDSLAPAAAALSD